MRWTRAAVSLAAWPLIIVFFPVVLVAGEPGNRYVMRRARWSAPTGTTGSDGGRPARVLPPARMPRHVWLLFTVMRNPLWIALTAPGRWVSDQFRRPPSRAGGR